MPLECTVLAARTLDGDLRTEVETKSPGRRKWCLDPTKHSEDSHRGA